MPKKAQRPTSIAEVPEYEKQVAKQFLDLFIKDAKKRGIEVIMSKNSKKDDEKAGKELESLDLSDFDYKLPKKPTLQDVIQSYTEGSTPSILNLPPIVFPSESDSKATVAYLNVQAVSWLDVSGSNPLYHELLSLVRERNNSSQIK